MISPLLANVYLDDFDEALEDQRWKLIRYADDFVVLSRSQSQLQDAHQEVSRLLTEAGLVLHPEKTHLTSFEQGFRFLGHAFAGDLVVPLQPRKPLQLPTSVESSSLRIVHAESVAPPTELQLALLEALKKADAPIPPPLFVVLGYQVREATHTEINSDEIVWRAGMSSLYLVQQGTQLSKEQGRFILEPPDEEPIEIPILEVDRILVFGNVQLSTSVISTCLNSNIPVIFLSQLGSYKGHLWGIDSVNLTLEIAQFDRRKEEEF